MESPIIEVILRFGVKPVELAEAMHVGRNTLSQWQHGQRTMSAAVQQDFSELAALLKAYAARGLEPQAALAAWQPSTLITRWGRDLIETQPGDVMLTGDLAKEMLATGGNNPRGQLDIMVRGACQEIGAIGQEPGLLTIEQRMRLRRLFQVGLKVLTELNERDASDKEK
jgi:transcriptional regulator with XRE-family HTH domain